MPMQTPTHPDMARHFLALASRSIVLLALVQWLAPALHAQGGDWMSIEGPYGGTIVWDLEQLSDGSVLAATSNGVQRSLDAGVTWTRFSSGLTVLDVRAIHVDASGEVRVATYGQGLFKLSPESESWVPAGLEATYALSMLEPQPGLLLVGVNGDLYRSEDEGLTWELLSLQGYNAAVYSLAASTTHVFAATNIGVFRSTDLGSTWEFASSGLQEYDIRSIATNASGHVFAGANPVYGGCSLYRSRGNGSLWTCIQPDTDPLTVGLVTAGPGGSLHVGGFQNLFESQDEGNTWRVHSVSASDVASWLSTGTSRLVGTRGEGVVLSTDEGQTWYPSNTGLTSDVTAVRSQPDGSLVVTTAGGLFITHDYGGSWDRVHPEEPLVRRATDALLDADGGLLAATNAGLWRYDKATGWSASGPPGRPFIRDLALAEDGSLLAAYYAGAWVYSKGTWTDAPIVDEEGNARDIVAVHLSGNGSKLAGAAWDSWRQVPGGSEWQRMSAGDPAWFSVQAFAESDGWILAGTRFAGVLQSFDDGQSWSRLGQGLEGNEDIRDIAFDSQEAPYIATFGNGVFRLDPSSMTWTPQLSGLASYRRVTSVTRDAQESLWIGTVEGGLFRRTAAPVGGIERYTLPEHLVLGAPWPNPSRGPVRFSVAPPQAGPVRFKVFDLMGRQVLEKDMFLPAGASTVHLDVPVPASGLYSVQAAAGRYSAVRMIVLHK